MENEADIKKRIEEREAKIADVQSKIKSHDRILRATSRKRKKFRALVAKWTRENEEDQTRLTKGPDAV